jgi:hypothetical protein
MDKRRGALITSRSHPWIVSGSPQSPTRIGIDITVGPRSFLRRLLENDNPGDLAGVVKDVISENPVLHLDNSNVFECVVYVGVQAVARAVSLRSRTNITPSMT